MSPDDSVTSPCRVQKQPVEIRRWDGVYERDCCLIFSNLRAAVRVINSPLYVIYFDRPFIVTLRFLPRILIELLDAPPRVSPDKSCFILLLA